MGTRGILGYIIRGQRKATYVHWDSYPGGLGADIASFLFTLTEEDYLRMAERLNQIEWVKPFDIAPADLVKHYIDEGLWSGIPNVKIGGHFVDETNPQWLNVLDDVQGGKSLQLIFDGRLRHLWEDTTLDAVWMYWLDFDKQVLLVEGEMDAIWPFDMMKVPGGFWARKVQEKKEREENSRKWRERQEKESARWTARRG